MLDILTPVLDFTVDLVYNVVQFLRSIEFAPGISWWSISVVLMFIGVTISLFVRTGKA